MRVSFVGIVEDLDGGLCLKDELGVEEWEGKKRGRRKKRRREESTVPGTYYTPSSQTKAKTFEVRLDGM
ncbi:predicted protein [Sclerotinia sclerotiorum 1980 UF-70]|uniref:Uncharacterized protein n=1 Tax=Sclerotinia sclerotiorum (strain ATCC 18683 / 1980 / Ss-1) TaxID=665079 RepID=A7ENQ8_SCLS1|nr:predicted protein [Sclerotinia sclerotiorum 1980 UF-70]EDO04474.1 predicted protein [Sclerotinia sclerotiorum 1980 UF-70]